MEVAHSSCSVRKASRKRRITELENDVHGLEQRYTLLVSEKVVVEEVRSALEVKLDALTQSNEGLMIQNESLERNVGDHDKLIVDARAEAGAARCGWDWLLRVGVIHIMYKLIEHPEFTGDVSQIRHATFVVGEESCHSCLKAVMESGSYDPDTDDSRSSQTMGVNESMLAFVTMDHASLLGLGNLDIEVCNSFVPLQCKEI